MCAVTVSATRVHSFLEVICHLLQLNYLVHHIFLGGGGKGQGGFMKAFCLGLSESSIFMLIHGVVEELGDEGTKHGGTKDSAKPEC